jgi:hypothetical protein
MRLLPLLGVVPVAVAVLAARWLSGRQGEPLRAEQPTHVRLVRHYDCDCRGDRGGWCLGRLEPIDFARESGEALAVGDGRRLAERVEARRLRSVGGDGR